MTETKTYCDHCGTVLNEMKDYIDLNIELGHIWRIHDLCAECLDELKDIVDRFCTSYKIEKDGVTEWTIKHIAKKTLRN